MTAHYQPRRHATVLQAGWSILCAVGFGLRAVVAIGVLTALVAGLPWALVHYVGWPLPDHVPNWDEIQATLLTPMSATFLLNFLACLCWVVWFAFTVDVIGCTVDAARGIIWPHVRPAGPLRGLAAALIGAIVLAAVSSRTSTLPQTSVALVLTSNSGPAAASQDPQIDTAPLVAAGQPGTMVIDRAAQAPPGMVRVAEAVRPPANGIYDSLWRIAERVFPDHDGARWPELFAQNRGVVQFDGRSLTVPNLIRPGWKITAFIPDTTPPVQHTPETTPAPVPAPPTPPPTSPTSPSTNPAAPNSTAHDSGQGDQQDATPDRGLDLAGGVFVSLGLAAVVATAMLSIRTWHRRRYRIGSGERDDLDHPIAPVVRALRLAHEHTHDDDVLLGPASPAPRATSDAGHRPRADRNRPARPAMGIKGGTGLALDLALTHGLGLVGPGATAAARALLVHLLAERYHGRPVQILIPATDLHLVLDDAPADRLPAAITVTSTLDAALDELETALLTRTRDRLDHHGDEPRGPRTSTLVLLATPQAHAERRLQGILDNGSALAMLGILIGQWRPGATARVHRDGTVSVASAGIGDRLAGARLFTLPGADTADLLALLRDADGPLDDHGSEPPHIQVADVTDEPREPRGDHSGDEALPAHLDTHDPILPNEPAQPPPAYDVRVFDVPRPADAATQVADEHDSVSMPCDSADLDHSATADTADLEPEPARQPVLRLQIFGHVRLTMTHQGEHRDLSSALTPKQREVLVFLALHPQGIRREALNDAIWPDANPDRPYNNLHYTLSTLRKSLSEVTEGLVTALVLNSDGRYHLDPAVVGTDYGQFHTALVDRVTAAEDERLDAHRRLASLYQGELAEDLDRLWLDAPREAAHRNVLDAVGVLIGAETDPATLLPLLERARELDPHNEGIYQAIIRTQARLEQYEAITRTVALLTTRLNELGQRPSEDTVNLVQFLRRRGSARRGADSGNAAAS
jgi:DNA-binding SARP family transcriptional activator